MEHGTRWEHLKEHAKSMIYLLEYVEHVISTKILWAHRNHSPKLYHLDILLFHEFHRRVVITINTPGYLGSPM